MVSFDAYVTAALFDRAGAVWALGDGTVRFEGGAGVEAHDGAVLCAAPHPSGEGVITGGDDGRLMWSRPSGAVQLADAGGRWIDAVASSAASGLMAYAAGREVRMLDAADPGFSRSFGHGRTVAGLAFDAKGRRLATATYGGARLWWARIAEQKPVELKWAGSHLDCAFSPDGRFLFSSMGENALHGWRLSDGKDMRMGGYPSKVRSLAFPGKGQLLVTSGAPGAVVWPIAGPNGPMGKEAAEIGYTEGRLVTRAAAAEGSGVIAAGCDDGRVWTADLASRGVRHWREPSGSPVSALAITRAGRLAWGDEDGGAGTAALA
ncbi:MAG: WD40 repeat domain-containing protein [Proteobacteria bacterium]|nr:WD40 repeat domain-containing protein [Pseudomonadota bacterium]